MVPPALAPIASSAIRKQMHATLKLTRHLPVSRLSPLSQLLSNKASASWEAAIRESMRTAIPNSEWATVGIQPKELESTLPAIALPTAPEKRGGLLSFFSRTGSVSGPSSAVAEPVRPASRSGSPRPSTDVVTPSSPNPSPLSAHPVRSSLDRKATPPVLPANPPPVRNSSPPVRSPTSPTAAATPAAQSAVSRFLGRWSKSTQGARTVSLSDSDFAYLEDVPTIIDEDDGDDQMKALEKMLASKPPLPPTKLPPPLAPPPKNTTVRAPPVTFPAVSQPAATQSEDDPWDIFRTATPPILPKPSSGVSRSRTSTASGALPPLLPPPGRLSQPNSRPTTPLPPPPKSVRPTPTVVTSSLLARRTSNAVHNPPASTNSANNSPSGTPITSSKPSLSPIIITPSPIGSGVNNAMVEDDGFGDFMSGPNDQWLSPNPQPQPQNGLSMAGLASPRITAPDTPLVGSMVDRILPPARQSLSPLLNKIAKTQNDRWPRPLSPGIMPPTLAPPPSNNMNTNTSTRDSVDLWGGSLSNAQPSLLVSPTLLSGSFNVPIVSTKSQTPGTGVGLGVSGISALLPPPPSAPSFNRNPPPMPSALAKNDSFGLLSPGQVNGKPKPGTGGGAGKLSASDLSFFEGL